MDLISLLVEAVVLVNLVASGVVLRVPVFSSSQRLLQLALIWLLPILGAVVCVAFAYSQSLGSASAGAGDELDLPSDEGGPDGSQGGICGSSSGGDGGGDGGD